MTTEEKLQGIIDLMAKIHKQIGKLNSLLEEAEGLGANISLDNSYFDKRYDPPIILIDPKKILSMQTDQAIARELKKSMDCFNQKFE